MLFDRICRENGITHRLTAPRSPTTTGKIERFHKTLRVELLDGLRFDSLAQAQQVIDAWVTDYNTRRPHQALAMATPAERFTATADPPLPAEPPLLVADELQATTRPPDRPRPNASGVTARLVHSNGVIVAPARSARSAAAAPASRSASRSSPAGCTSSATAPSSRRSLGPPAGR